MNIVDIGYSAGRGTPNEQANSRMLAERFFAPCHDSNRGCGPKGRAFSTWALVDRAVQSIAPVQGKYWVRTYTGRVYSGYAK